MSDFAVADLPFGKADGESRCVEQRSRRPLPQAVPGRGIAQLDSVAYTARAEAPAVEDDETDRGALPTPLRHIGGDAMQPSRSRSSSCHLPRPAAHRGRYGASTQARVRVTSDGEWLYQQPEESAWRSLPVALSWTAGRREVIGRRLRSRAGSSQRRSGATARAGADLAVTRAPEENLRDAPSGALIARLPEGFLLCKVGEDHRWVRVQRVGWMKRGRARSGGGRVADRPRLRSRTRPRPGSGHVRRRPIPVRPMRHARSRSAAPRCTARRRVRKRARSGSPRRCGYCRAPGTGVACRSRDG